MEVLAYLIAVGIGYLLAAFFIGSKCGDYSSELITRLHESEKEKQDLRDQIARMKSGEVRA